MPIVRGIRTISDSYARDFVNVPDTDENISNEIIIGTSDEEICCIKIANAWPDYVSLNASINPVGFSKKNVFAERIENGKSCGKTNVYQSPRINTNSSIKELNSLYSKIVINYENLGEYCFDKDIEKFQGLSFDDYEMDFQNEKSILFEKKFLTFEKEGIIEKYTAKLGDVLQLDGTSEVVTFCLHPYGGFYKFGDHIQNIESCIFHLVTENENTSLKISTLSSIKRTGIDPTKNQILKDKTKAIGVNNFTESQKMNLYEELKNGNCKIVIKNKNTNESCSYKSMAVRHTENTNMIKINFIKEK